MTTLVKNFLLIPRLSAAKTRVRTKNARKTCRQTSARKERREKAKREAGTGNEKAMCEARGENAQNLITSARETRNKRELIKSTKLHNDRVGNAKQARGKRKKRCEDGNEKTPAEGRFCHKSFVTFCAHSSLCRNYLMHGVRRAFFARLWQASLKKRSVCHMRRLFASKSTPIVPAPVCAPMTGPIQPICTVAPGYACNMAASASSALSKASA